MGRAKVIFQSEFPYNISARFLNRETFPLPLEEVWVILSEELYMSTILHGLKVHSFVLMSNHFHLIASTTDHGISEVMMRFMRISSQRIGELSGRINQAWGKRHFKTILGRQSYYLNAYKYNYFNPVKAGLVQRCEDYRFSSLRGKLGAERLLFPIGEDAVLFSNQNGTLEWLNRHPKIEDLSAVQMALRKPQFKIPKCPNSRKPLLALDDVI